MDIQCTRCGQEYVIDSAQVSSRAAPVRCSACGHEFLALPSASSSRAGAAAQLPPGRAGAASVRFPSLPAVIAGWSLKRADAEHSEPCPALHLLQRAVVEGRVAPTDRISPDGERWVRVRDMAELQPFFRIGVDDPTGIGSPPAGRDDEWQLGQVETHDDHRPAVKHAPPPHHTARWALVVVASLLLLGAGGLAALYMVKPAALTAPLNRSVGWVPAAAQGMVRAGHLALYPDTPEAFERARMFFRAAVEAAPAYADAVAGLAHVEVRWAEALQDESRALEARMATAAAAAATDPAGQQQALKVELEGVQVRTRGHLQRAWETLQRMFVADANDGAINAVAADYYRLEGQWATMREALDRAKVALPPGDVRVDYVVAAALAAGAKPDLEAAIAQLGAIAQRVPDAMRVRYRLGQARVAAGELVEAVDELESLLRATPDHARAQRLLAAVKARLAAEAAAQPVETFATLVERANRLRQADQAERAIELYRRAIAMDASAPEGYTGLGWCFVDLDEIDEAVATFRRALQRTPDFAEAHMGLAEAFRMSGQAQDAVKHYRRYLELLPDGPETPVARRMLRELSRAPGLDDQGE